MLASTEAQARGALAAAGASKVKVEGTSIRQVIQTLFAEEFAKLKKVRLTWNPSSIPEPADPSMKVGLLCKWKPYSGPLGTGRYYVQNMMVLYSNGEPVKDLSTISTEEKVERIVDGKGNFLREQKFPSDRKMVDDALRYYMQIAVRLDPNLCKFCVQFTTEDRNEYLRHMKRQHPHEFELLLKGPDDDDDELQDKPPVGRPRKEKTAEAAV